MKKILAIILVLAFVISFVGCAKIDETDLDSSIITSTEASQNPQLNEQTNSNVEESQAKPNSDTIKQNDKTSLDTNKKSDKTSSSQSKVTNTSSSTKTKKGIKKIVDESNKYLKTGNIVQFYKDDSYNAYYTVSGKNDGIIVYFNDGTKMGVTEAFEKGKVSLADLKKYSVKYIKGYQGKSVFDLTKSYDCNVKKKTQEFYKDKYFSYTFSTEKADYVKYLDKDGKTWTAVKALKSGLIKPYDLSNMGVKFSKKLIADKTVIVNESEGFMTAAVITEFFRDDKYIYEFSSMINVVVYYPDGTKEDVTKALEKGKIKVSDLDKFGIKYIKSSIADRKKEMHIVDLTRSGKYDVVNTEEEFYRDEQYIYLFPTQKSQYINITFYFDDVKLNVKEALLSGRIDIDSVLKAMDIEKIVYIKRQIDSK